MMLKQSKIIDRVNAMLDAGFDVTGYEATKDGGLRMFFNGSEKAKSDAKEMDEAEFNEWCNNAN